MFSFKGIGFGDVRERFGSAASSLSFLFLSKFSISAISACKFLKKSLMRAEDGALIFGAFEVFSAFFGVLFVSCGVLYLVFTAGIV